MNKNENTNKTIFNGNRHEKNLELKPIFQLEHSSLKSFCIYRNTKKDMIYPLQESKKQYIPSKEQIEEMKKFIGKHVIRTKYKDVGNGNLDFSFTSETIIINSVSDNGIDFSYYDILNLWQNNSTYNTSTLDSNWID